MFLLLKCHLAYKELADTRIEAERATTDNILKLTDALTRVLEKLPDIVHDCPMDKKH